MGDKMHTLAIWSTLAIAFIGYRYFNTTPEQKIKLVWDGLIAASRREATTHGTNAKIAVGFGSNIELRVDAVQLMQALNLSPPEHGKLYQQIDSTGSVLETLAYCMEKGLACERFVSNKVVLNRLIAKARAMTARRWVAGGHAVAIANKFAAEGFTDVVVGATASKNFKKLHQKGNGAPLNIVEELHGDDDFHLVLEYHSSQVWGQRHTAPPHCGAQRVVLHQDRTTPHLRYLESFREAVKQSQPRLVVISSLQLIEAYSFFQEGEREERLEMVRELLKSQPASTLLHVELGFTNDPSTLQSMIDHVIPYCDSIGLNGHELDHLVGVISGNKHRNSGILADHADQTSNRIITPATIFDAMRFLHNHFKHRSHHVNKRGISRIHVQTPAFQVILTQKSSAWKRTRQAAAKASTTASKSTCGHKLSSMGGGYDMHSAHTNFTLLLGDSFTASATNNNNNKNKENIRVVNVDPRDPVTCWTENDDVIEICVAPVITCVTDLKATTHAAAGDVRDEVTASALTVQI